MPRKYGLAVVCLFSVVLHLALTSDAPVTGQEKESEGGVSPGDAAEAYLKLSEPGPEHKKLGMRVGRWKVTATLYMAPGAPPMKSEGSSVVKSIMGGRYFQEEYSGEFLGQTFTGLGIAGYDKGLKKFVSSWVDSMSTGLARMEGTVDKTGDVITYVGEYFDPLREETVKNKNMLTLKSRDSHVAAMFEIAKDGSEQKLMELLYTRAP